MKRLKKHKELTERILRDEGVTAEQVTAFTEAENSEHIHNVLLEIATHREEGGNNHAPSLACKRHIARSFGTSQ